MINDQTPLVELHRHLDGNIHSATIWDLAQQYGVELPAASLSELTSFTQVQGQSRDLLAFLTKLDVGVSVLAHLDACRRVAYENIRDAKASGLDYVELRFSPYYMAMNHHLPLADVVEAVADGVAMGEAQYGVKVGLIGILSRTFGIESCANELDALLAHKDRIIALDLAGDEISFPPELFETHFIRGKDAGWHITVHAGEAAGPQSIWGAIKNLGATRIGHGCAAAEDPQLMDYMREHHIAIESCITSNYQTNAVDKLTNHPLTIFLDKEIIVSLNTDNPAVSNITLEHEYSVAKEVLKLSEQQLKQLQDNGLKSAFLSESDRSALIAKKAQSDLQC